MIERLQRVLQGLSAPEVPEVAPAAPLTATRMSLANHSRDWNRSGPLDPFNRTLVVDETPC